jgi:hypothetical protein
MSSGSKSKGRTPMKSSVFDQLSVERSKRALLRDALRPNDERDTIELLRVSSGLTRLTSCHGTEFLARAAKSNCVVLLLMSSVHA